MKKKYKSSASFIGEILGILETVFIAAFIMSMIFTFVFKIATVKGDSMNQTLDSNDKIIAFAFENSPETGDIVIVDAKESVLIGSNGELRHGEGIKKQIVKRVIASGGQTVDIDFKKGIVYVDGVMLDEPYITGLTHVDEGAFAGQYPITIPEGYLFVMGDNRSVSKDSRSDEIGLVSEESVLGKVFFCISPMDRFGFLS